MNYDKYNLDLIIGWIMVATWGLVWLKMLIHFVTYKINKRHYKNWEELRNAFCSIYNISKYIINEFIEANYENTEKYPDLKKHADKVNVAWDKYYNWPGKKVAEYLKGHLHFFDSAGWSSFCVITCFIAFFGLCSLGINSSDFKTQKDFYDNGNYSKYTLYLDGNWRDSYLWKTNAEQVFRNAKLMRDSYFDASGNLLKGSVRYIIPDETGHYRMNNGEYFRIINTNEILSDLWKVCENSEELLK